MKFLLKLGRGKYSEAAGQAPSGIPQLLRQRCLVQTFLFKHQSIALELRNHPIARDEIPAQNALRQRILDLRLDGEAQTDAPHTPCRIPPRRSGRVRHRRGRAEYRAPPAAAASAPTGCPRWNESV